MGDAFMRREVCKSNTCCNTGVVDLEGVLWVSSGASGDPSSTIGDTVPSLNSSRIRSLGITCMKSSMRMVIQSLSKLLFSRDEGGGKVSSERRYAQASVPDLPLPAT